MLIINVFLFLVFLDLPAPWDAIPYAKQALKVFETFFLRSVVGALKQTIWHFLMNHLNAGISSCSWIHLVLTSPISQERIYDNACSELSVMLFCLLTVLLRRQLSNRLCSWIVFRKTKFVGVTMFICQEWFQKLWKMWSQM